MASLLARQGLYHLSHSPALGRLLEKEIVSLVNMEFQGRFVQGLDSRTAELVSSNRLK
jgi:hypothetical protein